MNSQLIDKLLGYFAPEQAPSDAPQAVEAPPADDPYDTTKLVAETKEFMEKCQKNRRSFDRQWFRSILYYLGNQWISWDRSTNRYKERKLKKWVPKPVTNRYASSTSAVCAAIQSTVVNPAAWPSTNDHEDIATANVADKVIEVIKSEIRHESLAGAIAKWQTLNGDCFVWNYYDKRDTSQGFITIPAVQCPACGAEGSPSEFELACPQCGAMDEPMQIQDPEHPSAQRMPVGRLKSRALSPLQVYFNMDMVDPLDRQRVAIAVSYELSTVKEMFPEIADSIQPDTAAGQYASQYFMDALAYATDDTAYTVGGSGQRDKVTLIYYLKMPTSQAPDGVQFVMTLEGVACEVGPLESFDIAADGTKTHFLPLVQIGYETVPGRAYSKTPMFDLLPKQDQLNRLESLMELASMKGVHSTWLLPAGASISQLSGEPAQVIRWTPTGTGAQARPEAVTASPFHAALLELKKGYEADFEELAGTFDALKGNTPKGVSAGYAIQLLTERSYGRFGPAFSNWEQGWIHIYEMHLKLFRTYATEPRFRKIKGAAGQWEIQHFSAADLTGSVDLRVEGGSSKPRSKLAEQALLEALFKMGIVNPQDPEQRFQVANMFGMSEVLGSTAEDERIAAGEWQELLDWQPEVDPMTGEPMIDPMSPTPFPPGGPMVDQVFDNHMSHIMEHRKPVRTDIWRQLPPWKQNFWKMHQLDHLMAVQAMQMQAQGGPKKPGGGGGDDLHAGSKADEMPDKAANVNKGSSSMGSGGANQYGG